MKKIIILILSVLLTGTTLWAQEGESYFGFGLVMSKIGVEDAKAANHFGVNGFGLYGITDNFDLGVGWNFYLPFKVEVPGAKIESSIQQIGLKGNYRFGSNTGTYLYAIGEVFLNRVTVNSEIELLGEKQTNKDSDMDVGGNVGLGLKLGFLYSECSYNTSFEKVTFAVGVNF